MKKILFIEDERETIERLINYLNTKEIESDVEKYVENLENYLKTNKYDLVIIDPGLKIKDSGLKIKDPDDYEDDHGISFIETNKKHELISKYLKKIIFLTIVDFNIFKTRMKNLGLDENHLIVKSEPKEKIYNKLLTFM